MQNIVPQTVVCHRLSKSAFCVVMSTQEPETNYQIFLLFSLHITPTVYTDLEFSFELNRIINPVIWMAHLI